MTTSQRPSGIADHPTILPVSSWKKKYVIAATAAITTANQNCLGAATKSRPTSFAIEPMSRTNLTKAFEPEFLVVYLDVN